MPKSAAKVAAQAAAANGEACLSPIGGRAEFEGRPSKGLVLLPKRQEFLAATQDPRAYAMITEGSCMLPVVPSGTMAIVSPAAELVEGGYVVLHFLDGRTPLLKRLVSLPPAALVRSMAKGCTGASPCILVEMLNPGTLLAVGVDKLRAIHAVAGFMLPEEYEPRRRPARGRPAQKVAA